MELHVIVRARRVLAGAFKFLGDHVRGFLGQCDVCRLDLPAKLDEFRGEPGDIAMAETLNPCVVRQSRRYRLVLSSCVPEEVGEDCTERGATQPRALQKCGRVAIPDGYLGGGHKECPINGVVGGLSAHPCTLKVAPGEPKPTQTQRPTEATTVVNAKP